MKFRKKPVVIEASQWHKNGDHPDDACDMYDYPDEKGNVFQRPSEGKVVRYFRHPDVPGDKPCEQCGKPHHVHGWIDTLEQGHRVCPGDWIITGVKGERYPCKPDIFAATYEPAETTAPAAAPSQGSELVSMVVAVIQQAYFALDDSEELRDGNLVPAENVQALSEALTALEEKLPAAPGYVSSAASNARHALVSAIRTLSRAEPQAEKRDPHFGGYSYEASLLRDLLAVIHRDGGHYVTAHGLDKAHEDGIQVVTQLLAAAPQSGVAPEAVTWGARCAALYQVIGVLAEAAGVSGTQDVADALDVAAGRGDVEALLPWPKAEILPASAPAEKHVCGMQGYDPMRDGPCPGCTPAEKAPAEAVTMPCGLCGADILASALAEKPK